MWFKNLSIYRFTRAIELNAETIEKQLSEFKFTACGEHDVAKFGWTAPLATGGDMFTHVVNDNMILIAAMKEERILPSHVIKKHHNEAIEKEESVTGIKLNYAEKKALKFDVIDKLIPQAFTKTTTTTALILPEKDLIVINASSAKAAENLLALLRKSTGSLPVVPICPDTPIEMTLTNWLENNHTPQGFTLGFNVELADIEQDGGKVKISNEDLVGNEELESHIIASKVVTKLELDWNDLITFKIDTDYRLKSLKFSDSIKEENEDIDIEDMAARKDADLRLMANNISKLMADLFKAIPLESSDI